MEDAHVAQFRGAILKYNLASQFPKDKIQPKSPKLKSGIFSRFVHLTKQYRKNTCNQVDNKITKSIEKLLSLPLRIYKPISVLLNDTNRRHTKYKQN